MMIGSACVHQRPNRHFRICTACHKQSQSTRMLFLNGYFVNFPQVSMKKTRYQNKDTRDMRMELPDILACGEQGFLVA